MPSRSRKVATPGSIAGCDSVKNPGTPSAMDGRRERGRNTSDADGAGTEEGPSRTDDLAKNSTPWSRTQRGSGAWLFPSFNTSSAPVNAANGPVIANDLQKSRKPPGFGVRMTFCGSISPTGTAVALVMVVDAAGLGIGAGETTMSFRVVAAIALWTLLIGPVLGPPIGPRANTAQNVPTPVKAAR